MVTAETDTVIVEVPYKLSREDLKLDPSTVVRRGTETVDSLMRWMLDHGMTEDQIERVMRAAVCLFTAKAGSWAQCIDTALIWECG